MQNGLVVLAHFLAINVHATTGNSIAILSRQSQELNEAREAKLPLPEYRPGWRHIGRRSRLCCCPSSAVSQSSTKTSVSWTVQLAPFSGPEFTNFLKNKKIINQILSSVGQTGDSDWATFFLMLKYRLTCHYTEIETWCKCNRLPLHKASLSCQGHGPKLGKKKTTGSFSSH